ncbi:MAG: MFS transporter [Chloroflexi bacterium]|nr:MFS transporter [Chloroflexota bacterium]
MWRLLRHGRYRWFWAGQSLSMAGDRVQTIALAWLVLGLGASPLTLGSVLLAKALTQAVLLPLAGAATDRLAAKRVVLTADLARALLMAALVVVTTAGSAQLWPLYVIEVGAGVADAFFVPALTAVIPTAVQSTDLAAANALLVTSEQVTMTGGPAGGGVLVAALGPLGAFALNACSFVFGAAGAAMLPDAEVVGAPPQISFARDVAAGLREARSLPAFGGVLTLLLAGSLAFNASFGLGLPTLAHARFGEGAAALGVLLASNGAGQLVGTVGAGLTGLPRRLGWLMIGHAMAAAAMFGVLAMSGNLAVDCAVLCAAGIIGAYADDVATPTWLQRNAKPGALGRLASVVEIARVYPEPLALAGFGALASWSLTAALLVTAGVMLGGGVIAANNRELRLLRL